MLMRNNSGPEGTDRKDQNSPAAPSTSPMTAAQSARHPISGLSVFIVAYNEADRIGAAIAAIRDLASEILVVDCGSTDDTREVAGKFGARVIYNAWRGYGPQKRFAEERCKGPWLLNLDADEIVPPELSAEIRKTFSTGEPAFAAYRLRIAEQFPGERRPHRFAYTLSPVRLYRKDAGRYSPSPVHDRVELASGVRSGLLKERIHHQSVRSLSHQISKLNSYSDLQVADMAGRGRKLGEWRILFEMPVTFLKAYVMRRHFLRGFYGIATAMNYAIARHLRIAKAIEMQRLANLEIERRGLNIKATVEAPAQAGLAVPQGMPGSEHTPRRGS